MLQEILCPTPQVIAAGDQDFAKPAAAVLRVEHGQGEARATALRLADDLLEIAGIPACLGEQGGWTVKLKIDGEAGLRPEGYTLSVSGEGAAITGADGAGLFYGGQTLLQLLALGGEKIAACSIEDWPAFKVRELMLDLGRAPYSMDLLRRAVRIMGRLKLNSLHLHLNDDQLNGLRFERLPIGRENAWAITIEDLRQLVAYARRWHVQVVPEIEAWGHAGSVCYHYPNLVGGPGMWGGFSFAIGEELYEVMERMADEVVSVMEDDFYLHWGLDEAIWAVSKSVEKGKRDNYTPEKHVARLHDVLMRVAERHGKRARMRIWADHGGRPVPAEIAQEVIVEPWMYFECREARIREKIDRWGGQGKPPFMCGAGMSSGHHHGHYGATRVWTALARDLPNCEGVDICLWESNDLASRVIGIYGGAEYVWSPDTPELTETDNQFRERERMEAMKRMQKWQQAFADADEIAIRAEMGFAVDGGIYMNGPLRGRAVAETATQPLPDRPEEGFGE